MTNYDTHPDALRLHGINHCQLLNAVGTKVNNNRLRIVSPTLCHKTYGILGYNYEVCQDVVNGLSSTIGTHMIAGTRDLFEWNTGPPCFM